MTSSRRLLLLLLGLLGTAALALGASVDTEKARTQSDFDCPEADGTYSDGDYCDKYWRCNNHEATPHWCPDGLVYVEGLEHLDEPCDYPGSDRCTGGQPQQDPQPNGICPRKYAYFTGEDFEISCDEYTQCVDGFPYGRTCPEGLAFDMNELVCRHADLVEACDAEAYLNFSCSNVIGNSRHEHPSDCDKFFTCVDHGHTTRPRLGKCRRGQLFDRHEGQCKQAEHVTCE